MEQEARAAVEPAGEAAPAAVSGGGAAEVAHAGWLKKSGAGFFSPFSHKRWCVLRRAQLDFYEDEAEVKAAGSVRLGGGVEMSVDQSTLSVTLRHRSSTSAPLTRLYASDDQAHTEWVAELRAVLIEARGEEAESTTSPTSQTFLSKFAAFFRRDADSAAAAAATAATAAAATATDATDATAGNAAVDAAAADRAYDGEEPVLLEPGNVISSEGVTLGQSPPPSFSPPSLSAGRVMLQMRLSHTGELEAVEKFVPLDAHADVAVQASLPWLSHRDGPFGIIASESNEISRVAPSEIAVQCHLPFASHSVRQRRVDAQPQQITAQLVAPQNLQTPPPAPPFAGDAFAVGALGIASPDVLAAGGSAPPIDSKDVRVQCALPSSSQTAASPSADFADFASPSAGDASVLCDLPIASHTVDKKPPVHVRKNDPEDVMYTPPVESDTPVVDFGTPFVFDSFSGEMAAPFAEASVEALVPDVASAAFPAETALAAAVAAAAIATVTARYATRPAQAPPASAADAPVVAAVAAAAIATVTARYSKTPKPLAQQLAGVDAAAQCALPWTTHRRMLAEEGTPASAEIEAGDVGVQCELPWASHVVAPPPGVAPQDSHGTRDETLITF